MMAQDSFFVALGVYTLIVMSPGPAFVFMTKVGLQEEKNIALFSILGYVCGTMTHATLAMFAIGTLVERHAGVGFFVSLLGGTFLIYLAVGSFNKAYDGRAKDNATRGRKEGDKRKNKSPSRIAGFQKGLLMSFSNPKALAFFIAVFAPLVAGLPLESKGLLLWFVCGFNFLWYGSVVFIFKRATVQTFYQNNAVVYDGLLGILLTGMGGVVLFEMRHYWGLLN